MQFHFVPDLVIIEPATYHLGFISAQY